MRHEIRLAILLLAALAPAVVRAQCTPGPHSGTISANQTWCLADSPHVLAADVTVAAGATLTIAPGVTVQAACAGPCTQNSVGLTVQGRLVAAGTSAQPVLFTLLSGGSCDHWAGLTFDGGTGSLSYTTVFKGGGYGHDCYGQGSGSVVAKSVPAPGLTLDHCTLGPNTPWIGNTNINPLLLVSSSHVTVSDSTFTGGWWFPVWVQGASSVLTLSNDVFTGNAFNRVLIDPGAMSGADFTLVPQTGMEAYQLNGSYTIPVGRTMTVEAGATVGAVSGGACNGNSWGLTIQGRLVAAGTAAQPVTFTYLPGGWPGDHWIGLVFDGGTGSLSYTTVSLGGGCQGCYCAGQGSIVATNVPAPGLTLDHCNLGPSLEDTLLLNNSEVAVNGSTFTGASAFPIHVQGASSVLTLTNNTFTSNAFNRVLIDPGAMSGTDFTLVSQEGLEAYQLNGSYTIPVGRTMTVKAGATVGAVSGGACQGNSYGLTIQGRLVSAGTAAQPVTFTYLPGGWPGDHWIGLVFDGGTGDLSHTTVSKGGSCQGCYCGGRGSVVADNVTTGEVRLAACRVAGSLNGPAVLGNNSHVTLVNTVISDNPDGVWGIQMQNNAVLTATHTTLARNPNGASIESGSTASFTNCIIAAAGTGVSAWAGTTVTMAHTLWDGVSTPTSGIVTQNGSINGPAAFAADGYHLTQTSAALGQGIATAVVDDIDGEIRPRPAGSSPDLGADETSWAVPINRTATPIALGQTLPGVGASGAYVDYVLSLAAGQAANLVVKLMPAGGTGSWHLYARLGNLPFTTLYDFEGASKPDGTLAMLIPAPDAGAWYLSVFYESQGGDSPAFQIQVLGTDRYVDRILPASGGNAGSVTAEIAGLGFTSGMTVQLRSGGTTLRTYTPAGRTETSLTVPLDLTGLAPQTADVAVIWPDAAERILSQAFRIVGGGSSSLSVRIVAPDFVRGFGAATIVLEYENTGNDDIPAPALSIASLQNLLMRVDPRDAFLPGPLGVLGIDFTGVGTAGTLPPGKPQRIAFQVFAQGAAHEKLGFTVSTLGSGASASIDWAAQEAAFRPVNTPDDGWARLWALFTADVGATWNDYASTLRRAATALSDRGRFVCSSARLLVFEMSQLSGNLLRADLAAALDAEAPEPGPPLALARVFPSDILSRFRVGPWGRGWANLYWDESAVELAGGVVQIRTASGGVRVFVPLANGGYKSGFFDPGRLVKSGGTFALTERDGSICRFDASGRLASLEDRFGNRVTVGHDGSGRVVSLTHTSGDSFALQYDANGRVSRLTDHAGRVIDYAYDASGEHLLTVTGLGGVVTRYTYVPATGSPSDHAIQTITYPDGSQRLFTYDAQGRNSRRTSNGGIEPINFTGDNAGRVATSDANGRIWTASFDENGRFAKAVDPLGNTASLGYDVDGDLTRVVDASGGEWETEYGPLHEVTSSLDPIGSRVSVARHYPASGGTFVTSLADPGANKSLFALDSRNALTAVTYPDGSSEEVSLDGRGLPVSATNRKGETITFTLNARGLLTRKTLPGGAAETYDYDTDGEPTGAHNAAGDVTIQLDARRLPTQVTGTDGHAVSYEHDDAGHVTRRIGADGFTLVYQWDAAGRLSHVTDGVSSPIISYEYDAAGRLSVERKGNGTSTTYGYNQAGRIQLVTNYGPTGQVLSSFAYTFDASGNPLSMTTLAGTTSYHYDAVSRLIGVDYPDGHQTMLTYDASGNRVQVTDNGIVKAYTHNSLHETLSAGTATFVYDAAGQLVSKTDASGTTTYGWDAQGQLVNVVHPTLGTFTYDYDALGRRVAEHHGGATRRWLWEGSTITAEYDGTGALVARYVTGDGLVSRISPAGTAAYYAFDAIGHTRQLTDPTGAIVDSYDYGAFGEPVPVTESIPNPFRYAGRFGVMTDAHGLLFMRARSYDPSLGRFVSPDPLRYAAGFHLYNYGNGNPVRYVDPSGLDNPGWDTLMFAVSAVAPHISRGARFAINAIRYAFITVPRNCSKESSSGPWYIGPAHTVGTLLWGGVSLGVGAVVLVGGTTALAPVVLVGGLIVAGDEYITALAAEDYHGIERSIKEHPVKRNRWAKYESLKNPDGSWPDYVKKQMAQELHRPEILLSGDPNEKVSTPGAGPRHLIAAGSEVTYTVAFENVPTASAPAQVVVVTDALDGNLDWSTLRLTEVAWGDQCLAIASDEPSFVRRVAIGDYRPGDARTWWVDTSSSLAGGQIAWTFRTIDPETNDLPSDALAGFLPPDDATGRGRGHVTFAVRTKAPLPAGTRIDNGASVVFDQNGAIATNTAFNTIGLPGDVNDDGVVDPGDVFYLVNTFFGGGPQPLGLADSNGDGSVTVVDVFHLVNYLFASGPAPVD